MIINDAFVLRDTLPRQCIKLNAVAIVNVTLRGDWRLCGRRAV